MAGEAPAVCARPWGWKRRGERPVRCLSGKVKRNKARARAGDRSLHQDILQGVPKERRTLGAGEGVWIRRKWLGCRSRGGRGRSRGGCRSCLGDGRGGGAPRPFSAGMEQSLESNLEVKLPGVLAQNRPQSGSACSVRKVCSSRQSWGKRLMSEMYLQNLSRFGNRSWCASVSFLRQFELF